MCHRAPPPPQVHHSKLATLSATHDQHAMLQERQLGETHGQRQAETIAQLTAQLAEARQGYQTEMGALERKLQVRCSGSMEPNQPPLVSPR